MRKNISYFKKNNMFMDDNPTMPNEEEKDDESRLFAVSDEAGP